MTEKDLTVMQRELEELRRRVAQLEEETAAAAPENSEWTRGSYLTYYATTGFFLGMAGAVTSLLFNVAGAYLAGKHPLELIRVYLTFGLGARALDLNLRESDGGLILIIGCCLYVATGMLFGALFQVAIRYFRAEAPKPRFLLATGLGLVLWLVNYYVVIASLQEPLFGGQWILTEIPWWVAALTHLVFAWTMALVYPLGKFEPYRVQYD